MSSKDFDIDLGQITALEKLFKLSKKTFVRAAAGAINNIAFAQRLKYIDEIRDRMTVRNDRFVASQIRVTSAKARDLNNIQAQVGSIQSARFSGWGEQERGDTAQNHRMITAFGRVSGDKSRVAKGPARAKSTNNFAKISDYSITAKDRRHRLIIFLKMVVAEKKAFVMHRKYKGLKRGLYFVKGGKIKRVQTFGQRQVKKNPWMQPANQALKHSEISNAWKKSLDHFIAKKLI